MNHLVLIDEQVLRLEISVQVTMRVAVRNTAKRLVGKRFDVFRANLRRKKKEILI